MEPTTLSMLIYTIHLRKTPTFLARLWKEIARSTFQVLEDLISNIAKKKYPFNIRFNKDFSSDNNIISFCEPENQVAWFEICYIHEISKICLPKPGLFNIHTSQHANVEFNKVLHLNKNIKVSRVFWGRKNQCSAGASLLID